jgi:hypothetical protein
MVQYLAPLRYIETADIVFHPKGDCLPHAYMVTQLYPRALQGEEEE